MLHERQDVKWNLNCVFIGCDCHIQPWTSASALSLKAIGHLLKQLVCHLHFVTFQFATLPTRDACRVCRFYSTTLSWAFVHTECCSCRESCLLGVSWGSDLQWDSELPRIEVAVSDQQLGWLEKMGTHPEKKSVSTARSLKISPGIQSLVPGLVSQPQVPNSVRFPLTISIFLINRICVKFLCVSDVGRSPAVILHETKSPASAGQNQ